MGRLSCFSICCIHFVPLNFATRIKLVCGRSRNIRALVRLGKLPILSSSKSNAIERQSEMFYVTKLQIGYVASVLDEWGKSMEHCWNNTQAFGEKRLSTPLCPPQIPLVSYRIWAFAVSGPNLITWSMARPVKCCSYFGFWWLSDLGKTECCWQIMIYES